MRYIVPSDDRPVSDAWFRPLEHVALEMSKCERWSDQFFDIEDFMLMGGIERRPRPLLVPCKHVHTRRYLNLDLAGRAYRYFPPKTDPDGAGRCVEHRTLRDAIDHVALYELPWMKTGLESFRMGLTWEDRWILVEREPDTDPARHQLEEGNGDGSLHLV